MTEARTSPDLDAELQETRRRVDARLEALLQGGPERLCQAMRYVVLGGGKRLRPILVLWTQEMLAPQAEEPVLDLACAFELVHAYSLVHDDLPCMDDDDLRRGRPTCHVQFDEATAVLAGDALLNLAYETILSAPWTDASRALRCARQLAAAASHRELVGGQMLDLQAEGQAPEGERVKAIHAAKTAAMIRGAMVCGALAGGAGEETCRAVADVGQHLGLAFQILDDVLDVVGKSEQLGKTAGKDASVGKMTYPAVFGVEASREQAGQHVEAAIRRLQEWPRSSRLQALAAWLGGRRH
jgi:geranylgeranyl diphosphate synthase type II